jgi:methionine--tRNA ligase beta chain
MVTFDDFKKLDLRIGTVLSASRVEGTDKLILLEVDLGSERRQVVAGMAEFFDSEHFVGKQIPIITNLPPRVMRGVESQGMVLAADVEGHPVLLHPEKQIPPGSIIR